MKRSLAAAAFALVVGGVGLVAHETETTAAHAGPLASTADTSIADVAERVVGSVVNVSTTVKVDDGPYGSDPFFNDPFSPMFGQPAEREAHSLGSGVIVTARGRILTNNHVVANAKDIKVLLSDGNEYEAKVVGTDPKSDLAVLQLQGDLPKLTPIQWADSAQLRLGDVVLAVGNPFGVGQAVTMGIVSAKGRANMGIVDYEDFIQTDAAINPGNSGGALVDMHGNLVGINTAILSRTGGYQGIGFAIPSNMARPIMDALVKEGRVSRGYLGIGIATINRELAKEKRLAATNGVLVTHVEAGSPAALGGLREGDVIVSMDGAAAHSAGELRNTIALKGANKPVTVAILRGSAKDQLKVTLGEVPDQLQQQPPQAQPRPRIQIRRR